MPRNPHNPQLSDELMLKKDFLIFIDALIKNRMKAIIGKHGKTYIPALEIPSVMGHLDAFTEQMRLSGILIPIMQRRRKRDYMIAEDNGDRVVIVDCVKTHEEIMDYKMSLHIPGSLSLQVENNLSYYQIYRTGRPQKKVRLSEREGALFNLLHNNAGKFIKPEVIKTKTNLSKIQISTTLNAVRRKIAQLDFTADETKKMLPQYDRQGYAFLSI